MKRNFLPGEEIIDNNERGFTYGIGTYEHKNKIKSLLFGTVEYHNTLVSINPHFSFKYSPNVGDVVIGRVVEIYNNKWRIDCNSVNHGSLSIGCVLLPGVAQRIRDEEDEMEMRNIFNMNDIVVCEVQKVNKNKTFALHSRSEKYGKLIGGMLVKIPAMFVKKQKTYFQCSGFTVFVGSNGFLYFKTTENYKAVASIIREVQNCVDKKEVVDFDAFLNKFL